MRPVRLAARRRLRKVLDLHHAGVPIEEISYRMNAKPGTVKRMLADAGIYEQKKGSS